MRKIIVALAFVFVSAGSAMAYEVGPGDLGTPFQSGDVLTIPARMYRDATPRVAPVNPTLPGVSRGSCQLPRTATVVVVAVRERDLLLVTMTDPHVQAECEKCKLFYMASTAFDPITVQQRAIENYKKEADAEVRRLVRENGGHIDDPRPLYADCKF